ncbi:MAG: translation initiation factor IF-6, partial [Candidatus Micrarchaeia archaeon]
FDRASMFGNPFIGLFASTNDDITLVGMGASDKFIRHIANLQTEIIRIPGYDLAGIYSVMNNKGMIVSSLIEEGELRRTRFGSCINVEIMKTRFNAVGNNIAANDNGAIVNPDMNYSEVARIRDVLDVEVVKTTVAGYKTVGAMVLATNRGFITHPKSSSDEIELMSSLFRVNGGTGTANTGVPFIRISVLAKKKAL